LSSGAGAWREGHVMAAPDLASDVYARAERRLLRIDPLLPWPRPEAPHCGAPLGTGHEAGAAAVGRCEHWTAEPGSLDLSWGAARRFQLSATIAGPDVAAGLGQLITQWRDHLATVQGTGEDGAAAIITWPSRDADGVRTLLRHGFDPLEVLAARTAPRRRAAPPLTTGQLPPGPPAPEPRPGAPGGSLRVRRAWTPDADVVARLAIEVIRFDSRFGAVNERPDTLAALRREAAGLLAGPEPWAWLAERDGEPVGLLAAQRPEAAHWIAPLVRLAPAAYLMLMFVDPAERGSGVGGRLVAEFHREADAAGVAVTLLHYELLNPLSMPFWSRHGYRPLWTTWQATPASAIG
jgi:GNAT superfamily N-acetyltransferase